MESRRPTVHPSAGRQGRVRSRCIHFSQTDRARAHVSTPPLTLLSDYHFFSAKQFQIPLLHRSCHLCPLAGLCSATWGQCSKLPALGAVLSAAWSLRGPRGQERPGSVCRNRALSASGVCVRGIQKAGTASYEKGEKTIFRTVHVRKKQNCFWFRTCKQSIFLKR